MKSLRCDEAPVQSLPSAHALVASTSCSISAQRQYSRARGAHACTPAQQQPRLDSMLRQRAVQGSEASAAPAPGLAADYIKRSLHEGREATWSESAARHAWAGRLPFLRSSSP